MPAPNPNPAASKIPTDKLSANASGKLPDVISPYTPPPPPPLNLIESSDPVVYGTEANDRIIGVSTAYSQELYGLGGDDTLQLPSLGGSAYGGAGNDAVFGGTGYHHNYLYGDDFNLDGVTVGGDDRVVGGDGALNNHLYGDGVGLHDIAVGGNDTIIGGTGAYLSTSYGDAWLMTGNAKGGNDTIVGGSGTVTGNFLYGDSVHMDGNTTGGNDRLISAEGTTDYMWGDYRYSNDPGHVIGGADVFVFAGQFGGDVVGDFRASDGDKIEIDLDDGVLWTDQVSWVTVGTDLFVTVDSARSSGTITLVGLGGWTPVESDFLFV